MIELDDISKETIKNLSKEEIRKQVEKDFDLFKKQSLFRSAQVSSSVFKIHIKSDE